jgi:hypothetical protein
MCKLTTKGTEATGADGNIHILESEPKPEVITQLRLKVA